MVKKNRRKSKKQERIYRVGLLLSNEISVKFVSQQDAKKYIKSNADKKRVYALWRKDAILMTYHAGLWYLNINFVGKTGV